MLALGPGLATLAPSPRGRPTNPGRENPPRQTKPVLEETRPAQREDFTLPSMCYPALPALDLPAPWGVSVLCHGGPSCSGFTLQTPSVSILLHFSWLCKIIEFLSEASIC